MERKADRASNPRASGKGSKPGQSGEKQQGGREHQPESDKPTTRPTPSGVPNEGRAAEDHHGSLDQGVRTGRGDNEQKRVR